MTSSKTNLADCTATELVNLYRTGQASPVEAARAVLVRIAELDPVLNAYCLVDADRALAGASGLVTSSAQETTDVRDRL